MQAPLAITLHVLLVWGSDSAAPAAQPKQQLITQQWLALEVQILPMHFDLSSVVVHTAPMYWMVGTSPPPKASILPGIQGNPLLFTDVRYAINGAEGVTLEVDTVNVQLLVTTVDGGAVVMEPGTYKMYGARVLNIKIRMFWKRRPA
jgi:hypothetical protein